MGAVDRIAAPAGGGPPGAAAGGPQAPLRVLVAVHGIGDQTGFGTLQQLVNLCLGHRRQPRGVPIGKLHSRLRPPEGGPAAWAEVGPLPGLGFAEVFWADIGRAHESHVLEDPVRWAETIVQRLDVLDAAVPAPGDDAPPLDRAAARRVLHDFGQALRFARLLNHALVRLGAGSIDLDRTLVRSLGDVQLFAEYAGPRAAVLARFHEVMRRIDAAAAGRDVEIHICAHSQGSVVALLGLLEACVFAQPWLDRVRSLLTIGSPIDKFLILWPELFAPFVDNGRKGPRIRWRNYNDLTDPVGYELDTARAYWPRVHPALFREQSPEDRQFRRYLVPGKSHVDYWHDQEVFAEWLAHDVGLLGAAAPPGSRALAAALARVLLFALPLAFSWGAAHALGAAIQAIEPAVAFDLFRVGAMGLLIYGTVALAGARHASRRARWPLLGVALFAAGAAAALAAFPHWATRLSTAILLASALVQNVLDSLPARRAPAPGTGRPANGSRRSVTWIAVMLVVSVAFATVTYDKPPGLVFGQALLIGTALVCWALAGLSWGLLVVWVDHVSGSHHLDALRRRWRIGAPPRERTGPVPRGVWWLGPQPPEALGRAPSWVTGEALAQAAVPAHPGE